VSLLLMLHTPPLWAAFDLQKQINGVYSIYVHRYLFKQSSIFAVNGF